ncbi:hypothetical protein C7B64_07915 [Merismopedia glauca CCAP 1448/3]|uniref:Uncharacterized protein n=1 Tax=Merismopedia glauca CCAP 1448/3 TaxID=1296344 RepID=A0A2T1C612_9CYAN|nr:hypothetical protein C7B64_07915 [Merismopedia glauca CCAP 1448/3]
MGDRLKLIVASLLLNSDLGVGSLGGANIPILVRGYYPNFLGLGGRLPVRKFVGFLVINHFLPH